MILGKERVQGHARRQPRVIGPRHADEGLVEQGLGVADAAQAEPITDHQVELALGEALLRRVRARHNKKRPARLLLRRRTATLEASAVEIAKHVLLACGRELGPVLRDLAVQVELTAVGQDQRAQSGHGLGRRPDVDDGVALPGSRLGFVDVAAPQIDDELAFLKEYR